MSENHAYLTAFHALMLNAKMKRESQVYSELVLELQELRHKTSRDAYEGTFELDGRRRSERVRRT